MSLAGQSEVLSLSPETIRKALAAGRRVERVEYINPLPDGGSGSVQSLRLHRVSLRLHHPKHRQQSDRLIPVGSAAKPPAVPGLRVVGELFVA